MTSNRLFNIISLLVLAVLLGACRGQPSDKPPIQLQQNMYWQQKFKAFEPNEFFEDGRAMRLPVEGTIPRGHLRNDTQKYEGVNEDGSFVNRIPIPVDRALLERGQRMYNITCTPCHGLDGFGNGIVIGRGYVPPPSFHEERILDMPDGEIYSAIYNGANSMPSFRRLVKNANDRWAIVAYIRALQVSQSATEDDLSIIGMDPAAIGSSTGNEMASN